MLQRVVGCRLAHHTSNFFKLCGRRGHWVLVTLHPAPCWGNGSRHLQQKKVREIEYNHAPVRSHGALNQPGREGGVVAGQVGWRHLFRSPHPRDHGPPHSLCGQGLAKRLGGCVSSEGEADSPSKLTMPQNKAKRYSICTTIIRWPRGEGARVCALTTSVSAAIHYEVLSWHTASGSIRGLKWPILLGT